MSSVNNESKREPFNYERIRFKSKQNNWLTRFTFKIMTKNWLMMRILPNKCTPYWYWKVQRLYLGALMKLQARNDAELVPRRRRRCWKNVSLPSPASPSGSPFAGALFQQRHEYFSVFAHSATTKIDSRLNWSRRSWSPNTRLFCLFFAFVWGFFPPK